MTASQLHQTREHYLDMFATDLSDASADALSTCDNPHELEAIRDTLSAGEFDAAEAILLNL